MALIEMQSIDRDRLLDAISGAVLGLLDAGIREDMVGIVAGGLQFLITGEDGERLDDSDLRCMGDHEDALAGMLFCDLRSGWQGFPGEEDKQDAWTVCNIIAAAFVKSVQGGL
jgi:hypothetical protein